MLAEKIREGKIFLQLLHQSKLEESSEDLALRFKMAALGGEELTSDDWDQLYYAVDQAYPSFAEALLGKAGEVTKQQKQACYLLRFGMPKNQIQSLTHASRATIWRWEKKYAWALGVEEPFPGEEEEGGTAGE